MPKFANFSFLHKINDESFYMKAICTTNIIWGTFDVNNNIMLNENSTNKIASK